MTDPFCWFWLHFKEGKQIRQEDYWQCHLRESEISSWRGIVFEEVCLRHIKQIKQALQIGAVSSTESAYIAKGNDEMEGMQIDLIINRNDDVVNICELKYSKAPYIITQAYANKLTARQEAMEKSIKGKTFLLTYIGSSPLADNEYSYIFPCQVILDDLFG